ncbi:glycosyltransferase involved in cell wall biosynthesis [Methanococcus voltae]|uniref:Glycosyltransferase involved in cell wall biosynthesis n=1 Tax=Methanococcus voltae TaxID=2188 RepID=A0A8J7RNI6_METVO|nr:glycosyltransferase family 4 protein [Methanococcus voltae]MBP2201439.1 glycosyltransferase involved in cell wall biosynthesis [Methanococcus voltae]
MKIVMTATNPVTNDPRIIKEAKTLKEAGHDVKIVAWDRECKNPSEVNADCIEVIRIPIKSSYGSMKDFIKTLPVFYKKAIKILKKMDFDVIHTHDFDTAFLGYFLKKRGKKNTFGKTIKWVYDIHDLYFTFLETDGKSKSFFKDFLKKMIIRMDLTYVNYADNVITVSENIGLKHDGLKEFYTDYGICADKFTIIWNSPDIEAFLNYEKLDLKKSDKFTIGFIGGIRTSRNFEILFRLTSENKYADKIKFLIVGKGHRLDEIKNYANKYGVDAEFTGAIDYNFIPNYYALCDIIYACYPMRENVRRAMPLKVLESACLGIPVIVNENTIFEDYVLKNNLGISIDMLNESDYLKIFEYVKNFGDKKNKNNIENNNCDSSCDDKNNGKNNIKDWEFQKRKLIKMYENLGKRKENIIG